jgi:hypothetical protein
MTGGVSRSVLGVHRARVEWLMSGTHRDEFDGLSPTGRRFRVHGVNWTGVVLIWHAASPGTVVRPWLKRGLPGSK